MVDLPNSWEKLLEEHWEHIKIKNVDVISPQNILSKKRTFSLIFKVPVKASGKIYKYLEETIPERLKRQMILQPWKGYHFTVQWSPEESLKDKNISQVIEKLQVLLVEFPPIKGDLLFPFFGRAGLLGIFKTETDKEFFHLRQKVNEVLKSFNLPLGVPPKYSDLAYLSLTRYKESFTPKDKQFLKNLSVNKTPSIVFSEALLVLNDKFMTSKNTKIFKKLTL